MAKQILPVGAPLAEAGTFSGKVAFSNGVRVSGGELLFISGQLEAAYSSALESLEIIYCQVLVEAAGCAAA